MGNHTLEYGYLKNITFKTRFFNFFRQIFFLLPLEKILVKATQSKPHGSFASKFVPNHYQYPVGSLRKASRDGVNYELDLSDLVDWWVYYGFEDPGKTELFSKVKKGDLVIDIGANMGDVSFNFAKLVGPTGKVISFEPDRSNFLRFEKNARANNFDNIILVKKGIGNEPGKYTMAINGNEPGNAGSKRIVAHAPHGSNEYAAEIIALDSWLEENPIPRIDILKMDIEGYETSALKSGIKGLKKYRPIMYLELHDIKLKEHGSSAKEMAALLRDLGYQIVRGEDQAVIDNTIDLEDAHFDIVCYPKKRNNY